MNTTTGASPPPRPPAPEQKGTSPGKPAPELAKKPAGAAGPAGSPNAPGTARAAPPPEAAGLYGLSRAEVEFLPEAVSARSRVPPLSSVMTVAIILLLLGGMLYWSTRAELDEVARGEGRIIPSQKLQIVQNLEGGILQEILVEEGDTVRPGQILLRIDKTSSSGTYGEIRTRLKALEARAIRLEAEVADKPPEFTPELLSDYPEFVRNETRLYTLRQENLRSNLSIARERLLQREAEVQAHTASIGRIRKTLDSQKKELAIHHKVFESGGVSEIEVLQLEREIDSGEGELRIMTHELVAARAAVREASSQTREILQAFHSTASQELTATRSEYAATTETLPAQRDRVQRTEVRSPVRGIVQRVNIRTIGGIIQPGEDLFEIVPLDDTLLVEARILPADIAFIRPDLKATVKLSAYDYAVYGGLDGKVEKISATTETDQRTGEVYYLVQIRTSENTVIDPKNPAVRLPIIPGMVATVDILTGKKTVFQYIIRPALRAQQTALTER